MNELGDLSERVSSVVSRNDSVQIELFACVDQHHHKTFVVNTQNILDQFS